MGKTLKKKENNCEKKSFKKKCLKTCGACEKDDDKEDEKEDKEKDDKKDDEKDDEKDDKKDDEKDDKKDDDKDDKKDDEKDKDDGNNDIKTAFKDAILKRHNELRADHSAPAMSWDEGTEKFAQKWCDHLAATNKFEHSKSSDGRIGMGENLYKGGKGPGAELGTGVVNSFYSEEPKYDYEKNEFQYEAGHFSQVVWVKSTGLGCAYATNKSTWVCCNYKPAGNSGGYKENVLPKKEKVAIWK